MSPNDLLVDMALKFVGITEEGQNHGHWIEIFQKCLGNPAAGQAYCMDFCQYLLGQVDAQLKSEVPTWPGHQLYKSQACLNVWNMTKQTLRREKPEKGLIAFWGHWRIGLDPKGKRFELALPTGHCGVVTQAIGVEVFTSVEANTSPNGAVGGVDKTVVREGDGIYLKRRTTDAETGTMRFLGFIDPFG